MDSNCINCDRFASDLKYLLDQVIVARKENYNLRQRIKFLEQQGALRSINTQDASRCSKNSHTKINECCLSAQIIGTITTFSDQENVANKENKLSGKLTFYKNYFSYFQQQLKGFKEGSQIWVSYHNHRNNTKIGEEISNDLLINLSTNHSQVGLSLIKITAISNSVLHFETKDTIKENAVIDLKPHLPQNFPLLFEKPMHNGHTPLIDPDALSEELSCTPSIEDIANSEPDKNDGTSDDQVDLKENDVNDNQSTNSNPDEQNPVLKQENIDDDEAENYESKDNEYHLTNNLYSSGFHKVIENSQFFHQRNYMNQFSLPIDIEQSRSEKESCVQCKYCGEMFTSNWHLARHKPIHASEESNKCPICNKSFNYKMNLTVHMRSHTGEKPHTCYVCNRAFSQKVSLSVHMRRHTGEKPFCCDYCKRPFSDKSSFIRHLRIHTKERPYRCFHNTCNKAFTRKEHLISHARIHEQGIF